MTTANPIANAALAESLGKDGSWLRVPHTCAEGCSAKGRLRSQISFAIAWLINSARPAEKRAEVQASFHLGLPPGRAKAQRATVASASTGTAQFSKVAQPSPSHSWRSTNWLTPW